MPLTILTKDDHVRAILATLLAGGSITDVGTFAVARQLSEAMAAELASQGYSLYDLLRSFYITTATGVDLRARILDMGGAIDDGQAASDPVTFTRVQTWLDDIPLPAPQVLQATLSDGTAILYRSIGDVVLQPQGRSVSGQAPAAGLTSGSNDQLRVNLDGDGVRTLTLGTQTSTAGIAAAIQSAVRALTANSPGNQPAYDGFRCDYDTTTGGALTLRSGSTGPTSSVIVTAGAIHDATLPLKLGLAQGGLESSGQDSLAVSVLCDQIGVIGNVGAGQIHTQVISVAGIQSVANALMFSNGREPASDDSARQDLYNYLRSLHRGAFDAVEGAVYNTIGSDGQRHVMSAQVVNGAGHFRVYICDGRSLSVGAQTDVIQDVQDELDGLGQQVGGWNPVGNTAGVVAARVHAVPYTLRVSVGPGVDKVLAQQAITSLLYTLTYQWPIGTPLSYAQVVTQIDQRIPAMLGVTFTEPGEFVVTMDRVIGGAVGEKLMPSTITVEMVDA